MKYVEKIVVLPFQIVFMAIGLFAALMVKFERRP